MAFGALLRELRLARRLSQGTLAERAGLSIEAVSSLERGFRRTPQRYTIDALARALELAEDDVRALQATIAPQPLPRRRTSRLVAVPAVAAGLLPHAPTRLVGRDHDLARVLETLARAQVVTLVGPGGIGKTRLAIEAARSCGATAGRRVVFIDLSAVRSGEAALQAFATALGVALDAHELDVATLARAVSRTDALLLVDNCEHLIEAVSRAIGALAAAAPALGVLATSREDVRVRGAMTIRVGALAVPAAERSVSSVEEARAYPAVALFEERARAHHVSFALEAGNVGDVVAICGALDGLPLAIELAAARIRVMTTRTLRSLMARRLETLRVPPGDGPPRHETLTALIDWSYVLLGERERACFAALAVFQAAFTLEAAVAVVAAPGEDEFAVLDVLDALVSKSMLACVHDANGCVRYAMLDTMRAYGAARLEQHADRDGIGRRFVGYVHGEHVAHAAAFEHDPRMALLDPLVRDLPNTFAALDLALALGLGAAGGEILTLTRLLWYQARYTELGAYASRFLAAGDPGDDALQARLTAAIAFTRAHDSSLEAMQQFERALELARASQDRPALVMVLELRTLIAYRFGRLETAHAGVAELEGFANPTARDVQYIRIFRALRATYTEERERAIELSYEIVESEAVYGNERNVLVALNNIAEAEHARGRTERALVATESALEYMHVQSALRVTVLANRAGYLAAAGRLAEARAVLADAFALRYAAEHYAAAFVHLALVCGLEGRFAAAAALLGYIAAHYEPFDCTAHYTERTSHDRLTELLARELPTNRNSALQATGRTLDFERALDVARASAPGLVTR